MTEPMRVHRHEGEPRDMRDMYNGYPSGLLVQNVRTGACEFMTNSCDFLAAHERARELAALDKAPHDVVWWMGGSSWKSDGVSN